jgi:opacity protein-like surface antigen
LEKVVIKTKNLVVGLLGALAMLTVPAAAMAQKAGASPWYVGLHFGQSDIDEVNETDTAFRILGGYQFNKTFAAELAYTDFGSVDVLGTSVKGHAIELVGVASWPLADRFSVYGKLGFNQGEIEAGGASDDSIELTYGIGVRYDFSPNMGARLEWQQYPDVGDGATDVSVLSVGIVFKF